VTAPTITPVPTRPRSQARAIRGPSSVNNTSTASVATVAATHSQRRKPS
jgi:hypothetical protein